MMTNLLSEKLLMGGEEKFEPITFSANASLQTWTVPAGVKKFMWMLLLVKAEIQEVWADVLNATCP